jgi:DNA-binding transcriptional LysR family regulator
MPILEDLDCGIACSAMTLEARLRSLLPFWSWLPAFRAVAETEHLPSAAKLLGVGPSTLSRSIALLERALSKPLFARSPRKLQLNAAGRAFLASVRDAMRLVDDGRQDVAGSGLRGPLVVASGGAATTVFVAPALVQMRHEHPRLEPTIATRNPASVPQDLLRGSLDVAFQEACVTRDGLTTTRVARIQRGVYCGRKHPLFDARRVTERDLAKAEFVAPPHDPDGVVPDGWPVDKPRRIALTTDQLRVGVDLCETAPLLAVLPDALVSARGGSLRRLPVAFVPPAELFATHRRVLGPRLSAAVDLVARVSAIAAQYTKR